MNAMSNIISELTFPLFAYPCRYELHSGTFYIPSCLSALQNWTVGSCGVQ